MTTLIAVHNKERCIGTCDYRCYTAMQPSQLKEMRRTCCTCICGGANHGVGQSKAVFNHARGVGLLPSYLEDFAKSRGLNPDELVVIDRMRVQQTHKAAKLAKQLLNPPPVPADDLFACEEVSP